MNIPAQSEPTTARIIAPTEKSREAYMIGYDLIQVWKEYQAYQMETDNPDGFAASNPLMQTDSGRILIDVTADNASTVDTTLLQEQLSALGFEATGTYGRVVSGFIPVENVTEVAQLSAVKLARPAYKPVTNVGAVTSQADQSLNADTARNTFGVDGTNVNVGVLSDSFNNLGGFSSDVATGDLPEFVNVLEDLNEGGSDEGRAMLQLIHDVAPGADLAFTTAFTGQANFAQGILDLANTGSDIIVDDVIYLNEPFYQDGIVAQAVDEAVTAGAAYFSAAGNSGDRAYESAFQGSGQTINFGNFQVEAHDFDPGAGVDLFQSVTIPVGGQVSLAFQWDSPFFSVSGGSGSQNDYDIFLLDSSNSVVVAASTDPNIGNDPAEILSFNNTGAFGTSFNLVIGKFSGPDAGLMKYVGFGDILINEFDTASSTLFGHANAEGAQAVGAVSFLDTPEFGANPPEIEAFSAVGTTPILFDEQGDRLAQPEIRQKPDIVAPDGTNTTFFGQDIAGDLDGFPNFFGTSAAAPHAAAVAALLKQLDPTLTPDQINELLRESAIDMDDPSTPGFDVGFDLATGFGLIQADQALARLSEQLDSTAPEPAPEEPAPEPIDGDAGSEAPTPPPLPPAEDAPPDLSTGEVILGSASDDDLTGTVGNDVIRGRSGDDKLKGLSGDDRLIGNGGNDRLIGGSGNDNLRGGGGDDRLRGGSGNDSLNGNGGGDRLNGQAGDDLLNGGNGDDRLNGGTGNDELIGGRGDDLLIGGRGDDIFVLGRRQGTDLIRDFNIGEDVIRLQGSLSFSDLSFQQQGNSTLIEAGSETLATLRGVQTEQLDRASFV